jgi:hypothetical protein
MAVYRDGTPTDIGQNDRWSEHVLICPDCEATYSYPQHGRTHCQECGAHGLMPDTIITCGYCFADVPQSEWIDHKEVCLRG